VEDAVHINALLKATCVVDGFRYTARTYQISEQGMTLVTSPDFPKVDEFQLDCQLDDSHQMSLQVKLRHRKPVRWQQYPFHMMDTVVSDSSQQDMRAFVEHLQQRFQNETVQEAEAAERRARGETVVQEEGSDQRIHIRLTFNLPVTTLIEGRKYQGMTRDFSIRGIGATFKEILPVTESINLVCEDPEGRELAFRVREMNRQIADSEAYPMRIGFKILSANKLYREFLEKHHLWSQNRAKEI
jgi:hypothetical protein